MAEKAAKKVSIAVRRSRPTMPKVLITTGFKLRTDKVTGLLEVYLEGNGQTNERVCLDANLLQSNLDMLKRYAAGLTVAEDDTAHKEEVSVPQSAIFSNVVHFSHMGKRAETIFGLFAVADWAEATSDPQSGKTPEIQSVDVLAAISTLEVQKKLLLEMILLMSQ